MIGRGTGLAGLIVIVFASGATAQTLALPEPGLSSGLVADRTARRPGDSLLVLVMENSTASNSVRNDTDRRVGVAAELRRNRSNPQSVDIGLDGEFRGAGQTGRTGRMVAQISVTVTGVMPNGDLQVQGEQRLNINGEQTFIRVAGRVRPADISAQNTVLSSRLADAAIDYDGAGFVSRGSARGPVGRVFSWLGLL